MLILYGSTTGSVVPSGLRIIRGQPRNTIQGPNPMTTIIRPAEVWQPMDVSERDFVRVSYEEMLDVGETITSVVSVTCEDTAAVDADPSARLSGAAVVASPVVSQLVDGVVDGANYLVRFVCNTSAGRRLTIAGTLLGTRVGPVA